MKGNVLYKNQQVKLGIKLKHLNHNANANVNSDESIVNINSHYVRKEKKLPLQNPELQACGKFVANCFFKENVYDPTRQISGWTQVQNNTET